MYYYVCREDRLYIERCIIQREDILQLEIYYYVYIIYIEKRRIQNRVKYILYLDQKVNEEQELVKEIRKEKLEK